MRRQIRNRGIRFARGATGPYANKLKKGVKARAATLQRGGNIWTDNPDTVQAGWTDNGDGSYTCNGTDLALILQDTAPGALVDGKTYTVKFTVAATSGEVGINLYGGDDAGTSTLRGTNGSFSENVTIDITTASPPNRIMVRSSNFVGTISAISVRRLQ